MVEAAITTVRISSSQFGDRVIAVGGPVLITSSAGGDVINYDLGIVELLTPGGFIVEVHGDFDNEDPLGLAHSFEVEINLDFGGPKTGRWTSTYSGEYEEGGGLMNDGSMNVPINRMQSFADTTAIGDFNLPAFIYQPNTSLFLPIRFCPSNSCLADVTPLTASTGQILLNFVLDPGDALDIQDTATLSFIPVLSDNMPTLSGWGVIALLGGMATTMIWFMFRHSTPSV